MRRMLFSAAAALACIVGVSVFAADFSHVSDLISTSAPGADATHTIQFRVSSDIPPSGRIIVTPQFGQFIIPATFDYTDVDVALSNGGPYVDRDLASTADVTNDGVSAVTGAAGSVTIMLNSTTGISAGDYVQIRLGTNAIFGSVGTDDLQNPTGVTSYTIDLVTRDGLGNQIDSGRAMVAIVDPITVTVKAPIVAPVRSNGLPSGLLAANNFVIELSLETNVQSHCRYATTTDVLYSDMTADFVPISATIHWVNTTPYQNETTYNYYVRCKATQSGAENDDDYLISFSLKPTPSSNTSVETDGNPTNGATGDLGRGGTGDFPNGSSVLFLSTVTFSGYTVPNSLITILKDGVKDGTVQAKDDGTFVTTLTGIERGAYGFQLYSQDNHGLTSSLYGTTLSVNQGTDNDVTSIVIPPTIQMTADSIQAGDKVTVSGGAPPNSLVQVSVTAQSGSANLGGIRTFTATSTSRGDWSIALDTSQYAKGTYSVQARATISDTLKSGLSKTLQLAVGATATGGSCGNPDMNSDSKVNLVDFSIFLLSWQTTDAKADFNCDGQVNLGDFSIMLFNWTG